MRLGRDDAPVDRRTSPCRPGSCRGSPRRRRRPRRSPRPSRCRLPDRSPLVGSRVNATPAARGRTIFCTADAHVDRAVVVAHLVAVGDGAVGEQAAQQRGPCRARRRRPAPTGRCRARRRRRRRASPPTWPRTAPPPARRRRRSSAHSSAYVSRIRVSASGGIGHPRTISRATAAARVRPAMSPTSTAAQHVGELGVVGGQPLGVGVDGGRDREAGWDRQAGLAHRAERGALAADDRLVVLDQCVEGDHVRVVAHHVLLLIETVVARGWQCVQVRDRDLLDPVAVEHEGGHAALEEPDRGRTRC